ncbi:MAG: histidine phosphatase family protein [Mucilaginibacter sp.]|nr:histidine phosphatase family protein [Mucilaginibacter sp.]
MAYSQNADLKIIIIRHGEKPEKGSNLSCQGLNRALQLPELLHSRFGLPSAILVPTISTGDKTSSARMYQTIMPFAVKYGLPINSNYDEQDYKSVARDIRSRSGTVLLVWEHKAIPHLVAALGINQELHWAADDFDSIWIVTYKNGTPHLALAKEGLHPGANCPF